MYVHSAQSYSRLEEPHYANIHKLSCFTLCLSVCVPQAAERDWEEKRASLTQFSAQDINRLLEETQAELMKAIPDLDFAARQINKPVVPPKPQMTTPITSTSMTTAATTAIASTTATSSSSAPTGVDQQQSKVQMTAQKLEGGSRRGSGGRTLFTLLYLSY